MEAKNKFYLEDGNIEEVSKFPVEDNKTGEVIYEVLRVKDKIPLFLKEHIIRMEKSFNLINREFPFSYSKISEYIDTMITANGDVEGNIKLTFNTNSEAFRVFYIEHKYPDKKLYESGVKTILFHGERKNPNAKIVDSEFRGRVNKAISEAEVYEAILVNNNGIITEGSKSNIFFIKDGKLITAIGKDVLKGVTREKIIELAKNCNIEIVETEVNYKEVGSMEAIFISGTSPKILPISQVEDIKISVNSNILRLLMRKFDENIEKHIKENKKSF